MKKLAPLAAITLAVALVLAAPLSAATQTWKNVKIVDTMCAKKEKAATENHESSCVVNCSTNGLGIFTDAGYFKFDEAGTKKAVAALKKAGKKEDTRVTVTGTLDGDTITVESIAVH